MSFGNNNINNRGSYFFGKWFWKLWYYFCMSISGYPNCSPRNSRIYGNCWWNKCLLFLHNDMSIGSWQSWAKRLFDFFIKNISWARINPATEEWQGSIVTAIENITIPPPAWWATEAKQDGIITWIASILEEMKQAFYMKILMATIKRLSFNSAWELRTVVGSIWTITTVTTVWTMTTGNIGIGDSGKTATMLSTSSNNFQSGARRLIRKV